jgi:hypothetical protein
MKTVTLDTAAPRPADDLVVMELAAYLAACLFRKTSGAFYGKWDEASGGGVWFYSKSAAAMFESPTVDEVILQEDQRWRFRSLVFRLGSLAAETAGDLCGVMRLVPRDPGVDPGPPRRYVVHASFRPEEGLWFRAAIVRDGENSG